MHFLTHYKITMQVEIITEGAFFSLKKSQVFFFAVSVDKNQSRFGI
jgi:hypothetical protein